MTSIQRLSTSKRSALPSSYLNRNPIATVAANVASVASRATCLMAFSSARGMRSSTTAPTAGIRTVRVIAHESNQFIGPISLRSRKHPQRQGEQPHRDDQHQRVELQSTGLHAADLAAGLAGHGR